MMTDRGRDVCPDLSAEFEIIHEILDAFNDNPLAWENFKSFPQLYQRVRIDNIQRVKPSEALFCSRLDKLIEASRKGEMIGEWNDCGRLTEY